MLSRARAHPNIALVKYWGKRDRALNLPAVSSLSLTLAPFVTETAVTWGAEADRFELDGAIQTGTSHRRVFALLDLIDPGRPPVQVVSTNSFPSGAGLASSASGFAALVVAATQASGRASSDLDRGVLARQGSGSATRSLHGGFVVWRRGERPDGRDSLGRPLAAPPWDLRMVVAIVARGPKRVGSTEGMELSRRTSPLYPTWVEQAEDDVDAGIRAIERRDLEALGTVMEASTFKMHAVMATSRPPTIYALPATTAAIQAVLDLRRAGVGAWLTMDAGPQVKVLCAASDAPTVAEALRPHVLDVVIATPGGPATPC